MRSILKLFRISNIILVVLLQFFLRKYFVTPILASFGLELVLTDFQFYLLMLMTVCLTTAGYVINDYFDLKRDYINRNEADIIIGKTVKR